MIIRGVTGEGQAKKPTHIEITCFGCGMLRSVQNNEKAKMLEKECMCRQCAGRLRWAKAAAELAGTP